MVDATSFGRLNRIGASSCACVSQSLSTQTGKELTTLEALDGVAFDKAYVENEVAYHKSVNDALANILIPSAQNKDLKSLLETGLTLFKEHQMHAEHLASTIK
ncbi:DUF4142 domain-containing protein [Rhizobium laguerreae]|uniref:DUF4142 domain-containing protein n=1 Tax=Rhizobium laguerreae TaxID=1076926 RepID=UPI0031BAB342